MTLHGSVITRPGLSNEADKTWEIDSHSPLVFSLRLGLRNHPTQCGILDIFTWPGLIFSDSLPPFPISGSTPYLPIPPHHGAGNSQPAQGPAPVIISLLKTFSFLHQTGRRQNRGNVFLFMSAILCYLTDIFQPNLDKKVC